MGRMGVQKSDPKQKALYVSGNLALMKWRDIHTITDDDGESVCHAKLEKKNAWDWEAEKHISIFVSGETLQDWSMYCHHNGELFK